MIKVRFRQGQNDTFSSFKFLYVNALQEYITLIVIPSFYLTSLTIASVVNLILIQNGDSLIVG